MEQPDMSGKVLVIDDTESNVDLLTSALDRHGYTTYSADSGEMGLLVAQDKVPDVILLDINMPGIDGYETCRRLKSLERTADIPIIFISAMDQLMDIVKGFDAGGVDYITKPFQFREVLARVQTQVTLHRSKRELEQLHERERLQFARLDEMRTQFISSATHDLKNPIFLISGYADLLQSLPEVAQTQEAMEYVNGIRRGVSKMTTLVRDMLELLQLETGAALACEETSFLKFMDRVLPDIHMYAEEKQINFERELPDQDVMVLMDEKRMERVIDNLASNALKYTEAGGAVRLRGHVSETAATIEMIDSGFGIPANEVPNLFQPFKRVNTRQHLMVEGTGLGLTIVKTIVEQHNGRVEVESEMGQGSTFRVVLPLPA